MNCAFSNIFVVTEIIGVRSFTGATLCERGERITIPVIAISMTKQFDFVIEIAMMAWIKETKGISDRPFLGAANWRRGGQNTANLAAYLIAQKNISQKHNRNPPHFAGIF